jgi:hypothetical protein
MFLINRTGGSTTQLDRSGYMSSTCLLNLIIQVSSTVNVNSSLSGCCLSNIVVLLLRVSHNAPHVLHGQVTWAVYHWLHVPCMDEQCKETWPTPRARIDEPYGRQKVNEHGHPKKDPLGQESEAYKRRHIESFRGIKFIILNTVFSSREMLGTLSF